MRRFLSFLLLFLVSVALGQQSYWTQVHNAFPSSALSPTIMLQKDRLDYPEFEVFSQLAPNSSTYLDWFCTSRFNASNAVASESGTSRVQQVSLAQVCPRTLTSITPGTTASLSPTAYIWTAATKTVPANWTGPATDSGLANVYYTTTKTTESVTRTVVVPAGGRISDIVAVNTSNGGICDYTITQSAVSIPTANYTQPWLGSFSQYNQALMTGSGEVELAHGLPAGSYVVTKTLDASSPASSRLFDCSVDTTIPLSVSTPGEDGMWFSTSSGSVGGNTGFVNSYWPGAGHVYSVSNATRITTRLYLAPNTAQIQYYVYDSGGSLLAAPLVDEYGGGVLSEVQLATNLPKGNYVVEELGLGTKNPSSTAYRIYAGGVYGYDQTTAGALGVNPPSLLPNSLILGTGNLEHAASVRVVGSPTSKDEFSGGTHGGEFQGTPVITLDGTDITAAYNAAAVNTQWTGSVLQIAWTGNHIGFPQIGATISQTAGVATVVLSNHGFNTGDVVNVSAAQPVAYQGDQTITVIDGNTFTYPVNSGTSSPATGTTYCTRKGDYWCSFNLTQNWSSSGYSFSETMTTLESFYLDVLAGPNLMGPSQAPAAGFVGADSGSAWGYTDGLAPVRLTGQHDQSFMGVTGASQLLQTGSNQYLAVCLSSSLGSVVSNMQNRSDGYGKIYEYEHSGSVTGGDLIPIGTTFTLGGSYYIVYNAGALVPTVPRSAATTRVAAGARTLTP